MSYPYVCLSLSASSRAGFAPAILLYRRPPRVETTGNAAVMSYGRRSTAEQVAWLALIAGRAWTRCPQRGKAVDAITVAIGPGKADCIVAYQLCAVNLRIGGRADSQPQWVRLGLASILTAGSARTDASHPGQTVYAAMPVRPIDPKVSSRPVNGQIGRLAGIPCLRQAHELLPVLLNRASISSMGNGKDDCAVVFGADLRQSLQIAQLQRARLTGHDPGRLG